MQIQVNTDNQIDGHERLNRYVSQRITEAMQRFGSQLTRVEVHIHDDNSNKKKARGDDIRCVIESRPRGLKPVTVNNVASELDPALKGAIDKMERALEHTFGKLHAR